MCVEVAVGDEAEEAGRLFDDLECAEGIAAEAVLVLLEERGFAQSDPAYFIHVQSRLKEKKQVSREEFVCAMLSPPDYGPDEIPELKTLFQILDPTGHGTVSAEEFTRLITENPLLTVSAGFGDAAEQCFQRLAALYGNHELTLIEFLQSMTAAHQAVNR